VLPDIGIGFDLIPVEPRHRGTVAKSPYPGLTS
jgi:hypothetical protein